MPKDKDEKSGSTAPPSLTSSSTMYYLWPESSTPRCPEGTEVHKEECLAAGRAVSEGLSIKNPNLLYVDDLYSSFFLSISF